MKLFLYLLFHPIFFIVELYAERWASFGLKYCYSGIFEIHNFWDIFKSFFFILCIIVIMPLFEGLIIFTTAVSPAKIPNDNVNIAIIWFTIYRAIRFFYEYNTSTKEDLILNVIFTGWCIYALLKSISISRRTYNPEYDRWKN